MKEKSKTRWLFRIIKFLIRVFYPKMEVVGLENLPDEPVAIIGNHTQLNGPIACELFFSDNYHTWCASQMMELKEVPRYAFTDFWSQKPKYQQPFFRLVAYLIAPLSVVIFNNARTIPVYKDARLLKTFRETVSKLQDGNNVVIFPEHDVKYNHIVYEFQEGFVDTARQYYKKTGKELKFVPLYIAPKLRKMYLGKPIQFSAQKEMKEERSRICNYLMKEITTMAESLPYHTVVPYRNIPKKLYPTNIPKEKEK